VLAILGVSGYAMDQSSCCKKGVYSRDVLINDIYDHCTTCGDDWCCPSISDLFREKTSLNDTCVCLLIENDALDDSFTFDNLQNLKIVSNREKNSIVLCSSFNGNSLTFRRSKNISMENLTFKNCGNMSLDRVISSTFHFEDCKGIQLEDVNITGSKGYGLYFNDCSGDVSLYSVIIEQNHLSSLNSSHLLYGGGIVFQKLNDGEPVNLKFLSCKFLILNAYEPGSTDENHHFFGYGGGVSLLLNKSSYNKIDFYICYFEENAAVVGGALYIFIGDESKHNLISISSQFIRNKANRSGGAIEYYTEKYPYVSNNTITISGSFHGNEAGDVGGALSCRKERDFHHIPADDRYYRTTLENCVFSDNIGNLGSAIYLDDTYARMISQTEILRNNRFNFENSNGYAAVFSYSSDIKVVGVLKVASNYRTGICLDYSFLRVNGTINFEGNTGNYGGALALYQESQIILLDKANINFYSNHALKGGAIYVQYEELPVRTFNVDGFLTYRCFYEYQMSRKKPLMHFVNNSASIDQGEVAYITTLKYCCIQDLFSLMNLTLNGNSGAVNTDPYNMTLYKEDWKDIYPGQVIDANVTLRDELNNRVSSIVSVSIKDQENNVGIMYNYKRFLVVNDNIRLSLVGQSSQFNLTVTVAHWNALSETIVRVRMEACAFGYKYNTQTKICDCSQSNKITQCDGRDIYLHKNLWVFNNQTENIKTCPQSYCNCIKGSDPKRLDCLYQSNNQCAPGRDQDMFLCGKCETGRAVGIGSERCLKCESPFVKHYGIVWLLPLILLVTFIVVLFFIKIDIDVYKNYLNSTFYFYQVVPLLFNNVNLRTQPFILSLIHLFNLEGVGLHSVSGFCVLESFTQLDKQFFNYCFPFFAFVCIFVVFMLGQKFQRFNFNPGNFIHVVIFIIIWAYGDIVRVTFQILKYSVIGDNKRVFVEANEIYFVSKKHCIYAVIACLVSIVALIFPVVLVFPSSIIERLPRLKTILDSKYIFKENFASQLFISYYFVCRIVLSSIATFFFTDKIGSRNTTLTCVSVIVYLVFLMVTPYDKEYDYLNYFDGVVLFLVTSVALITSRLGGLLPGHPYITMYNILLDIVLLIPFLWVLGNLLLRGVRYLRTLYANRRNSKH